MTARFDAALARLARAGVGLSDETVALLDEMVQANKTGGFAPAEAYRDPPRAARRGAATTSIRTCAPASSAARDMAAADYVALMQERARLVQAMDARLADLDALLMPTTAIVAPKISEVGTPETFAPKNFMLLRNTAIVNFFDLCAISLPLPRAGGLPVGLMLIARNGHDRRLFAIAAAVEKLFAA